MSCFDDCDDFQTELQDDLRDILNDLEDSGLLMTAAKSVTMVYVDIINAKPELGKPGDKIIRKELMSPLPRIELNTKIYQDGVAITKTGNAKLSRIVVSNSENSNYTRKQLESVDHFLIDCDVYRLANGGLTKNESGLFWEMLLIRGKG